jgi:LysM repeat protein
VILFHTELPNAGQGQSVSLRNRKQEFLLDRKEADRVLAMRKLHRSRHQRAWESRNAFPGNDNSPAVGGRWLTRGVAFATLCTTLMMLSVIAGTQAGATTVRILPGQNLTEIAAAHGTSVSSLVVANGIRNPNLVVAGTTLVIPGNAGIVLTSSSASNGSPTVVVSLGDTLSGIAARYGTSVTAFAAANGISNPNLVIAGSRLAVPAPGSTGSGTAISSTDVSNSAPASSGASSSLPSQLLAYPDRLGLQSYFLQWASTFGVPASLLEAMCWWESGWQSGVISSTGAQGIGQLEPATVQFMRAQLHNPNLNPMVAYDNIEMSAAFLHDLLQQTGGNARLALASYYQGAASVRLVGMFTSTVQYVNGILSYLSAFS